MNDLLAILGKVAHRDIAPVRAADLLFHALADRIAETPEFIAARQENQRHTLRRTVRQN